MDSEVQTYFIGKIKEYKEKKRMKHSWVIEKMKGACRAGSAYKWRNNENLLVVMFVSDMCVPAMVAAQQSGYGKL